MPSPADQAPSLVFAPNLGEPNDEIELSREESHYVRRVCRLRVGDRVRATDGRGTSATVEILALGSAARVRIVVRETCARLRSRAVWCGAPQGQRADWLVEKLAELGVSHWQPIDCERAGWTRTALRLERWERLAIAALRQSRRPHRMEIRPPVELAQALAALPAGCSGWWADREGAPGWRGPLVEGLSVGVIGPAPGLSSDEKSQLEAAGFKAISLSDSRLRTETAALAWAVWSGLSDVGGPPSGR